MQESDKPMFTVIMDSEIADLIDESISPMDGLIAVEQVRYELAALHGKRRIRRPFRNALPIYRGLLDWCSIGFDYVEYGNHLHVLGVRYDISARSADAVIEKSLDCEKYVRDFDASDVPMNE